MADEESITIVATTKNLNIKPPKVIFEWCIDAPTLWELYIIYPDKTKEESWHGSFSNLNFAVKYIYQVTGTEIWGQKLEPWKKY